MKKEAFKNFLISKKIPIVVFLVLTLFFVALFLLNKNKNSENSKSQPDKTTEFINNECADCVRRKIDGVLVQPADSNLLPFAVVIDNNIDARPQYGLSQANLVYEAEAEGGITRYLAIFAGNQELEKIGPVRSARPYFIDWAQELSSLFVHCGGSPDALAKIIKSKVFNLNEFYNSDYFWRGKEKKAPNNIYTSSINLNEYINKKDNKEIFEYESWEFKDGQANDNPINPEIKIGYLSPSYAVNWKYDIIENNYIRHLSNKEHLDGNGERISAKNIIIQYLENKVLDDKLRLEIKTIGEGKAVFCNDGVCEVGKWKKISQTKRTKFFKNDNNEFVFNRGNIWIEVVNNKIEINY